MKNEHEFITETLDRMKEYLMKTLGPDKDHKGHDLHKVVEDGLARVFYSSLNQETKTLEDDILVILENELREMSERNGKLSQYSCSKY